MPTTRVTLGNVHHTDLGDGPAVLLVHGFPLDGRVLGDVATLLADRFRVIVPDLPGFGRSTLGAPSFTMDTLAQSLIELADAMGIERFAVAGLSMGGYVAQGVVRVAPQRLSGLCFVDTRANADDAAGRKGRDDMIALVTQAGTPAIVEQMLPKMLHPSAYEMNPALVDRQREIMEATPAATIALACAAMRDRPEFFDALATLPCPLQVIVGEGDAIASVAVATKMHELAPGSRLDVIRKAGHMAPIEQPDAVAAVMEQFLAPLA